MKHINSETCKWMKVDGELMPFSPEIPDVTNGNVTVKYYLRSKLDSLEDEFKGNEYVHKVSLAKMDVSNLKSLKNMLTYCTSIKNLEYNKDISVNVDTENMVPDISILTAYTTSQYSYIVPLQLLGTMPSLDTTISSVYNGEGSYSFFATDNKTGISCNVILSQWDNYGDFISDLERVNNPKLPYFVNTQHCKDLGVPAEEEFISKNNKGSIVTDPRLCLVDDDVITVKVPENSDIDYIEMHISGHNGAMSELNYVYEHEADIYLDNTVIVPASEGTTVIKMWPRKDGLKEYKFYNGTIENNKKVWASFKFYKINNEELRITEFPEPVKVSRPIPDSERIELERLSYVYTGVNALSGICLSEDKTFLYGVSDTYGLYKIEFDGTSTLLYNTQTNKAEGEDTEYDLEGLCMDENGDLFACVENDQQIVKFAKDKEYKTCEVVSNVDTDKLKELMKEFNNGFEGIAYHEGTFYLGNQFKPISVTKYSLTDGIIGDESVILKTDDNKGGTTEVGDLQYSPIDDTLWVIDSRSSILYNYDLEGNTIASYLTKIGKDGNTESFVIDFENNKLYVACDNKEGSLYTYKFIYEHTEPELTPLEKFLVDVKEGGTITLTDDIELESTVTFTKETVLDLAGHTIKNLGKGQTINTAKGIKLTITGNGKIDGGEGGDNSAVKFYGDGVIENGEFYVGPDAKGQGNGCVEISGAYTLEIKDGRFESAIDYKGKYYVINMQDNTGAKIIMTGGTVVNQDPSAGLTEPGKDNFVAEGYKVVESVEGENKLYTVVKA